MSRFLFANRYQAGDVIGRGTMSEVYRGQDKLVGRDVAIKVLRADLARDPSFQARFRREAKNAAALNHPAIVAVYDTGERETAAGAIPFIVMEYVAGQTLQEKLKSQAAAAAAAVVGDRRRNLCGAGLLAPPGHRAPRHQAGERDDRPGRRRSR